jgi:ACS family hexuronate transporter-like MFS transporter
MKKRKNLRWHLAFLLTLDTINNYLDRMTLPVAIIVINQSFEVTDSQYAFISSLFFLAYAIMYAGGGRLMDKLGTYWGFLSINIFWGLAVLAHGIANSYIGLGISRFFLGIGEGGGFPAASKAVSEWFPAKERSTAFGIFNTGSSIGSVLAVPLFSAIMYFSNWRWVFFVSGSIGFVWVIFWSAFYRLPKGRPRWGERLPKDNIYITDEELNFIQTAHAKELKEVALDKPRKVDWIKLFRDRELLGMIIAKFLTDAVWYFYIIWTPKYLFDARGFDIKQVGYYGWIPFAAAACGSMLGGSFSSFLIKKGRSVNASRKIALLVAALFMPASAFILSVPVGWAIVFISMAYFGHQFWNVINQTLPTDLYPTYKVGSVAGIIGSSGAFGGFAVQLIAGWMITTLGGYGPVFVSLSFMHPVAFVIILIMIPRITRLDRR